MSTEPERFSTGSRGLLEEPTTELLLSAASTWEIAIKYSLGKLPLPADPADLIPLWISETRVLPLPVEHSHALATGKLLWHHQDPFDRMLIAQAQIELLPIMTSDRRFSEYDVEVLAP